LHRVLLPARGLAVSAAFARGRQADTVFERRPEYDEAGTCHPKLAVWLLLLEGEAELRALARAGWIRPIGPDRWRSRYCTGAHQAIDRDSDDL
jgi:hypothetical protein